MKLYAGIDLHANNNYLAIIDEKDTREYKRKLPNQPDVILAEFEPFREDIVGIVVNQHSTGTGLSIFLWMLTIVSTWQTWLQSRNTRDSSKTRVRSGLI